MLERGKLILTDTFTFSLSWSLYYFFRVRSGWLTYSSEPEFIMPMFVIIVFWIPIFFLFDLYKPWYTKSRVDELATIVRAVTFGVLLLFFIIFIDDQGMGSPVQNRLLIAAYWGIMIFCVGSGRVTVHTFKRKLLEKGIGIHSAIIVGINKRSRELYEMIEQHPALGYRVTGFISLDKRKQHSPYRNVPTLGALDDLSSVIEQHNIRDILIALDSTEHDKLLSIMALCNGHEVSMKIVPDLYDIVSGQARTNQIYGFPLIEVNPELMSQWEQFSKRALDMIVSFSILALGMPLWLLIALLLKLDSRGPVLYTQERVGKDGKTFKIIKFRSMYKNAEEKSGPVWAHKKDPRVTRLGKILRASRLDEIPQFINVLNGDMSLVGPRPERPHFVEKLSKELPLYARRLKVRPGITGWAQVKHKYDESLEDVKKKVKYDLFYIENMSWRMDLKILLNTIYVVLTGRGH